MFELAPMWIAASVLVLAQLWAVGRLLSDRAVDRLLACAVVAYLILWNIIPGLICLMVGAGVLDAQVFFDANTNDLLGLYCLESALLLATLAVARVVITQLRSQTRAVDVLELPTAWVAGASALFAIALAIAARSGIETDYLARNSASLREASTSEPLFLILYTSLRSGVLYAYITRERRDGWVYLLLALLILDAVVESMGGARIGMFLPLFALLCRAQVRGAAMSLRSGWLAVTAGIAAFALMPLAIKIAEIRLQPQVKLADLAQVEIDGEAVLLSLFTKFNSFSSGLMLVDSYGPGTAGFAPYVGSVLVFVPRGLVPERPMAGSIDGTLYGTPARLVPQLFTDSDTYNVGVSPYAIAVWQWGWLGGAMVLLVVGAANLVILERLLGQGSLIVRILALSAVGAPTFMGVYNSPDALLKSLVQLLLLLGAVSLVARLLRRRREPLVQT